jgi:hypothetical protein
MNEIFPVLYGCGGGFLCSFVSSLRWRFFCWLFFSAVFGIAATVVTGEWKVGWEFLLIDIPLVAASSFAVMVLRKEMTRRMRVSE